MTKRITRTMPPGEWREIPGWEGKYYVNALGQVWSYHSNRILSAKTEAFGYESVTLAGTQLRVHRAVALAFLEQTGPLVRHLDGDPSNNHLSNLAWGTSSDNTKDSIEHGTFRHWNSLKSECKRGHPLDTENTRIRADGSRLCLTCKNGKFYPSDRRKRVWKKKAA